MIALPLLPSGPVPVALLPAPSIESPELDALCWLTTQVEDDPAFDMALAHLIFDPCAAYFGTSPDDVDGEEIGTLLYIARNHFPDLYVDFTEFYWNCSEHDAFANMTNALHEIAPQTDWVDFNPHYCLNDALGFGLWDEDFGGEDWNVLSDEIKHVLYVLGIDEKGNDEDIQTVRYSVCRVLIDSLREQTDKRLHNVGMLLHWLFVETGNELFDLTNSSLAEWGIEPYPWDAYIDAVTLQDEVNEWHNMAMAAVKLLNVDFTLMNALASNYRMIRISMTGQPQFRTMTAKEFLDGNYNENWAIIWTEPAGEGDTGRIAAQSDAQGLRFWRDTGNPKFPVPR